MAYWLPPIRNTEDILKELNARGDGYWREIKGIQSLNKSTVKSDGGFLIDIETGLFVKTFVNERTAEIKSYFVRYLDIPERNQ